jgi:hypothetical protein
MSTSQAGKGDKPRPINKTQYNANFDKIAWDQKKKIKEGITKKGKTSYKY